MHWRAGFFRFAVIVYGLSLLLAAAPALADYLVRDLGSLTERSSGGADINDQGNVAGAAYVTGGWWIDEDGVIHGEAWLTHGVLWDGEEMIDLGVLGEDPGEMPRPSSTALGLNNLNQVVGYATPISDHIVRGFVWLPEPAYGLVGGINELPCLAQFGPSVTRARAINDVGQIAGESQMDDPVGEPGPIRAVRWGYTGSAMEIFDLGTLDDLTTSMSRAYDINAHGEIVGESHNLPAGHLGMEAFLYLPVAKYGLPAGMNSLTPGDSAGRAIAINDLGQVAGMSGLYDVWLWLPEAAYGLPAGLNRFGEFPIEGVYWTKVTGINNAGQMVGNVNWEYIPDFHRICGWVWQNGVFTLLDDRLPDSTDWRVARALAISDSGHITGSGRGGDVYQELQMFRTVRLTPALLGDVDGDWDLDGDDFVTIAGCLAGPDVSTPPPGCTIERFHRADFQGDDDVDLRDWAEFQYRASGV